MTKDVTTSAIAYNSGSRGVAARTPCPAPCGGRDLAQLHVQVGGKQQAPADVGAGAASGDRDSERVALVSGARCGDSEDEDEAEGQE